MVKFAVKFRKRSRTLPGLGSVDLYVISVRDGSNVIRVSVSSSKNAALSGFADIVKEILRDET